MTRERIVIVADDDGLRRDALASVLRDSGYEARTAENGADALLLLDALGDRPCILLLDLAIRDGGGLTVLETLARAHRLARIPVIVTYSELPKAPLPGGIRHFLPKPLSLDALLVAIADLCRDELQVQTL